MGGRFWLGIVLLVVLFLGGLLLSGFLSEDQQHITGLLEQAQALGHSGDMPGAAGLAQKAYDLWQQRWQALAAIADHAPLDETEATFREVLAYGLEEDSEEFCASCGRLISGVIAIGQAHELSWWNIL